jgi:hypothetical protein
MIDARDLFLLMESAKADEIVGTNGRPLEWFTVRRHSDGREFQVRQALEGEAIRVHDRSWALVPWRVPTPYDIPLSEGVWLIFYTPCIGQCADETLMWTNYELIDPTTEAPAK